MAITDQLSGVGVSIIPATNVSITDAGNYYTSTNAEGALQEVGADIVSIDATLQDLIDKGLMTQADTIAALRLKAVTADSVFVAGYYAQRDGGHGVFNGVTGAAAGTYVDNGSTIIVPTGGNGSSAWLRVMDGVYNVRAFGAKGDGVANDEPAIQAAVNAVAASGVPAKVYIPPGTYKINDTITIDGSFVSIEGYALLDASSLTNSAALYITCSPNNEINNYGTASSFGRQMSITGNLRLKGPGYTYQYSTGVMFNDPSGAGFPTGVLENVVVSSFGVGVCYYNYCWGTILKSCRIFNCNYNILVPGDMVGGGERYTHYNCLIAGAFTANVQVDAECDMYFTNCSFDYPGQAVATGKIDNGSGSAGTTFTVTSMASTGLLAKSFALNDPLSIYPGTITAGTKITAFGTGSGGVGTYTVNNSQLVTSTVFYGASGAQVIVSKGGVYLTDCHIEGEKSNQALLQVGPNNSAALVIRGGDISLRSWYGQTASPIKITQSSTNRVSLIIDGAKLGHMIAGADSTNQYLIDTSGVSNTYYANVNIKNTFTYFVYTNANLASRMNNILADGGFEGGFLPDVALVEDTAAITNRLSGTNIGLTQTSSYFRTGASCLAAQKKAGNTSASAFIVMARLRNPGCSTVGFRHWDNNAASLAGTYYAGYGWARIEEYNSYGIPTVLKLDLPGATTITPTNSWTSRDVGGMTPPAWATHALIYIKLNNFATSAGGYLYFDDFEITEM